jgi:multidrug efflux pump subunit AcrA (membrane-fusion protein)
VNKKLMLMIAVVVVFLAAGVVGYRAWASSQAAESSEVQTETIQRGELASTLSSSGNTESGQSATIVWETSGKAGEITLQPGDIVAENQVIAYLDPDTLSTEMIQAKQDLIDAQGALDDLLNSNSSKQALQAVEDAQNAEQPQTAGARSSQAQLALAGGRRCYADVACTQRHEYPTHRMA